MQSKVSDEVEIVKPSEKQVRSQLELVLQGEEFKRSPKIANFLKHVVNETLAGKQQYIKAHTIAISVFQKDENFDPQTDPLVRVNAVRLRRMLRHYYSSDGNFDEVIIDIIKGSYVPRFYFRNKGDESPEVISELVRDHSFPSIAVLSLKNLSNNLSHSNYADGITDEIVSQLTKFKELIVVARSAINLTEDKLVNTKRLNKVIDVRYVLSGSVRIDEDNIRINVELDDRVSHSNVWTQTYNEKLSVKSMFGIQDKIAMHVATTIAQPYGVIIRKELANLERNLTNNFSAYELFLQYFQFLRTFAPKDHVKAREALEESTRIDPQFSDAWAALAIIYAQEYQLSMNQIERDVDVRELVYRTARQALKIDPNNSRSSFAISIAKWINGEIESSKEDAVKALKLNPNNSLILAQSGLFLALSGAWDKGIEMLEHAMVMNPAHPDFYYFPFALNYYRQGQFNEALREANNIHMPDYFWTYFILTAIYSALGDLKLAKRASHELLKLYPNIEEKARFELEKWDMQPDLIEKILEGLKQAGLKVS
ncbi:MAG: tetratricopeptide repeat protein [Gammaproteobacteria bacterium]